MRTFFNILTSFAIASFLIHKQVLGAQIPWFSGGQVDIKSELGPLLSKEASILFPEDEEFGAATSRWQYWAAPEIKAVVVVKNEEDIQQAVSQFYS